MTTSTQINISEHIQAVRQALDRLSEAWGLPAEAETENELKLLPPHLLGAVLHHALGSFSTNTAQILYLLGDRHRYGRGVPQDCVEAVKWYRLAAEQGDACAQYRLGSMYDYGDGVAEDRAEAVRWYRLAAEQGHAEARRASTDRSSRT